MTAPDRRRALDEVAAAAIAGGDEARLAGWWCRADPTLPFRRANAALPPIGAGASAHLEAAIAAVADWYDEHERPPRVQVSTADPRWSDLDAALDDRGWVVEAPVTVLTATVTTVRRRLGPPGDEAFDVMAGVGESWARRVGVLHGDDHRARDRTEAYGRLVSRFGVDGLAASVDLDGGPAAIGFGVRDGSWCGVFGMATAPAARRRGAARRVLHELVALAADLGAADVYLQLEDDNPGADALYRGLGFTPSHRYHYRTRQDP